MPSIQAQIGSIDAPQDQDVISGSTLFRGWGMDSQAPLSRVELFIDNSDIGSAGYGGNRSDACNAIGNWPGCPYVGWNYVLDTTVYVDGPHMLRVTLTTTDNRQSSMVRGFIVNNNTSVGLDSLSLYRLTSVGTGKVVDVNQASISDGGNAIEESYHYGPNQRWSVIPTPSGSFVFESLNSGRALGIPFGSTGNTSTVVQYPYYGAAEQEWILGASGGGGYAFYNRATNKVLDIYGAGNADGTPLDTFDYSIAQTQQWYLTPEPNPPSGLFGDGGSDGQSSVPQIPEDDLLFPGYDSGMASSFAPNVANGPACVNASELTNISTLFVPPDASGLSTIRYNYTNQTGLLIRKPPPYIEMPFDGAFGQWNDRQTKSFVVFKRQNTTLGTRSFYF